ncbi:hypothetical protein E5288_WYG007139 [Bos mutus]|uniref:Uncharacterized protein n=1 Tax=Bos mutus TaxID=72004 RepID=A0A6B0QS47_9CETA|nr:hypothetical protein [Bos mutus]
MWACDKMILKSQKENLQKTAQSNLLGCWSPAVHSPNWQGFLVDTSTFIIGNSTGQAPLSICKGQKHGAGAGGEAADIVCFTHAFQRHLRYCPANKSYSPIFTDININDNSVQTRYKVDFREDSDKFPIEAVIAPYSKSLTRYCEKSPRFTVGDRIEGRADAVTLEASINEKR